MGDVALWIIKYVIELLVSKVGVLDALLFILADVTFNIPFMLNSLLFFTTGNY